MVSERFMWQAPWRRTQPWRPYLRRGQDEWCNPSLMVGVPFLGMFIVFYGRLDRAGPEHWEPSEHPGCACCRDTLARPDPRVEEADS